jgi:hypothetical protein
VSESLPHADNVNAAARANAVIAPRRNFFIKNPFDWFLSDFPRLNSQEVTRNLNTLFIELSQTTLRMLGETKDFFDYYEIYRLVECLTDI